MRNCVKTLEMTNVCLSLLPVLPSRLDRPHRLATPTQIMKVLVRNHLSLDKAPLKVPMNHTRRLRSQTSLGDSPAPNLLLARYIIQR